MTTATLTINYFISPNGVGHFDITLTNANGEYIIAGQNQRDPAVDGGLNGFGSDWELYYAALEPKISSAPTRPIWVCSRPFSRSGVASEGAQAPFVRSLFQGQHALLSLWMFAVRSG